MDTEIVQLIVDAGLAVAAVGGDDAGFAAGASDHPFDSGFQPGPVGRIARPHVVVQHDPLVVVDELGLVAELDRLPESTLS